MKILNQMKLSFSGISANESFSRMAVSAFVSQLDPTIEELNDIKTAISEAVTNCIVHGYRDAIGYIFLTANIYEDRKIMIKIRDRGRGIEDVSLAMTPLYTTAPNEDRAGLGFVVMQTFMDKVTVSSKVGKGTSVTMSKRLNAKPGAAISR